MRKCFALSELESIAWDLWERDDLVLSGHRQACTYHKSLGCLTGWNSIISLPDQLCATFLM